jgi:hypothetical protein
MLGTELLKAFWVILKSFEHETDSNSSSVMPGKHHDLEIANKLANKFSFFGSLALLCYIFIHVLKG